VNPWILLSVQSDPYQFAQYGVLGIIVVGFIAGWIWPRPSVERLIAQNERLQAQVDALFEVYESKVMPTLVEVTEIMRRIDAHGPPPRRGPAR
jgi:hypothetical protein